MIQERWNKSTQNSNLLSRSSVNHDVVYLQIIGNLIKYFPFLMAHYRKSNYHEPSLSIFMRRIKQL